MLLRNTPTPYGRLQQSNAIVSLTCIVIRRGHTVRHLPERLFCRRNSSGYYDALARDTLSGSGETAVDGRSAAQGAGHCHYNRRHRVRQNCRTVRWWHTGLHACEHTVRQFAANRDTLHLIVTNITESVCGDTVTNALLGSLALLNTSVKAVKSKGSNIVALPMHVN